MKRKEPTPPRHTAVKTAALGAGAGALVIMGTVALQPLLSDFVESQSTVFVANTDTSPTTTPTVASAAPAVKATNFAGGDWPGMPTGK
jgi:hypothetical protein